MYCFQASHILMKETDESQLFEPHVPWHLPERTNAQNLMQLKGRLTPERAKAVQQEMQVQGRPRAFAGISFCLGSWILSLDRNFVQD
jgi:hypothetical protein